jgi:hypothetical protein
LSATSPSSTPTSWSMPPTPRCSAAVEWTAPSTVPAAPRSSPNAAPCVPPRIGPDCPSVRRSRPPPVACALGRAHCRTCLVAVRGPFVVARRLLPQLTACVRVARCPERRLPSHLRRRLRLAVTLSGPHRRNHRPVLPTERDVRTLRPLHPGVVRRLCHRSDVPALTSTALTSRREVAALRSSRGRGWGSEACSCAAYRCHRRRVPARPPLVEEGLRSDDPAPDPPLTRRCRPADPEMQMRRCVSRTA